ncbi:hypothetical protein Tco_1518130 [Tanacetum coccineum]
MTKEGLAAPYSGIRANPGSLQGSYLRRNITKGNSKGKKKKESEDVEATSLTPWPEFVSIAEILGLTRNDGDDVKKVYMVYLDVFVSYYKTARAPQAPAEAVEDSSLESYQWSVGKNGAPSNS